MKKIIVTGGCGFIGTNLIIQLLNNKKNMVINIDKFSASSNNFLVKNKFKNYHYYKFDLLNKKKLVSIIKTIKPDLIFHLAAESHVDTSLEDPIIFLIPM